MGKRVNLIRLMAHDEYISYRQFVTIQSRISYFLRGKLLVADWISLKPSSWRRFRKNTDDQDKVSLLRIKMIKWLHLTHVIT